MFGLKRRRSVDALDTVLLHWTGLDPFTVRDLLERIASAYSAKA